MFQLRRKKPKPFLFFNNAASRKFCVAERSVAKQYWRLAMEPINFSLQR